MVGDPVNLTDGRHLAMTFLERLGPQHRIDCVVVDGDPPSKARARWNASRKPYTPKKTIEGEKRYAAAFERVTRFEGNVALCCVFYRSTHQRVDVDNMLKAVLDAGTRAKLWHDDSQVTALLGIVEHDRDRPRAVVAFGEHTSSLTRGINALVPCEACGTLFFPGGRRRETARWCSRGCRMTLAELIDCPSCGQPFKRRSGNQQFCSGACRGAARSAAAAEARAQRTHCRHGHLLDEENTHVLADGRRRCRRCQAEAARRARTRKTYGQPARCEVRVLELSRRSEEAIA